MNIVGLKIKHKTYGLGEVVSQTFSKITVKYENNEFSDKEYTYQYPQAFTSILTLLDEKAESVVDNEIIKFDDKQRTQEERKALLYATPKSDLQRMTSTRNIKSFSDRPNIAFKCTYCDGGETKNRMGFKRICSNKIIYNNIEVEHRVWCSSPECPCCQYYVGAINREELEDWDDSYACYESKMLVNWAARAGVIHNGERKGQPMRLKEIRKNSLCILTTREPNKREGKRLIFAVFLVDVADTGDEFNEGYVACRNSKYRLELTKEQARKMLFWKYHANENDPVNAKWSYGLHRYMTNEEAAQILRDIAILKNGCYDHRLAEEFYLEFCKLTSINPEKLSEPKGAIPYSNVSV